MLVYRLPVPNEWVYSLKEVSLSKRPLEINDKLRARYLHLKHAGKPCHWPPSDDRWCDQRIGWYLPSSKPLPNPHNGEHFYAHQFGVACQQSPLINNCLAYVCRMYAKNHPETWERVHGETSFRTCKMHPEDHLFGKVRRALTQLLPELRRNNVIYDHEIFNAAAEWDEIVKSFTFYLPMIAKWCLHSYTQYPEDWTAAEGVYQESSIFTSVAAVSVPALVIDTMSPAIVAAMNNEESSSDDDEEKPKKQKVVRKKKEEEEYSWLDNPDHAVDAYHDE